MMLGPDPKTAVFDPGSWDLHSSHRLSEVPEQLRIGRMLGCCLNGSDEHDSLWGGVASKRLPNCKRLESAILATRADMNGKTMRKLDDHAWVFDGLEHRIPGWERPAANRPRSRAHALARYSSWTLYVLYSAVTLHICCKRRAWRTSLLLLAWTGESTRSYVPVQAMDVAILRSVCFLCLPTAHR